MQAPEFDNPELVAACEADGIGEIGLEVAEIPVHRSDLEKVLDVLAAAYRHHMHRDESNAALHLAPQARYSPLTSELGAARDRVRGLLDE